MPVHLTAAQARALGIGGPQAATPTGDGAARAVGNGAGPPRPRRPRGEYRTRCVGCDEVFVSRAGESRHVGPGHLRYDIPLTGREYRQIMSDTPDDTPPDLPPDGGDDDPTDDDK